MLNKKFIATGSIGLTLVLAVAGCGTGSTGGSSNGSSNAGGSAPASSGQQAQGVTAKQITIGGWQPYSGNEAQYGLIGDGIKAYVNWINAQGGVNGRTIKYIAYDDSYQTDKAVAAAHRLVSQDKVFGILGPNGTAMNIAAKPYLTQVGIPVVAMGSGSTPMFQPFVKNYFELWPAYQKEAQLMVKYALANMHPKRIAIFYQNDDFGQQGQGAAVASLKAAGVTPVIQVNYQASQVDFSAAAAKMKAANPDLVLMFSTPGPTAQMLKAMVQAGVNAQKMVTYVSGDPIEFKLAGNAFNGVITTGWMQPLDSSAAQDFVNEWKKDYPNQQPTLLAEAGWTDAQVFMEALKKSGNNLTWSNFENQMETIQNWNGSLGHNITFTSTLHQGEQSLYFMKAENGKLVKISDYIS
ncbi:ABC transporter substrate-binding protein [Alicyclobacillus tolerans]|uniref:ABC transporter substrate-binding protein n=1 Tax=Alicyclobacillus tolerans TaxID=90970 RepID=UPI001F239501|nr:ABC transporter substrate-binding protein [Alicyclobacillus tolerans]MCF8566477.1 ABC transporter substrate-binding protein [Alicyclobacillus tolerans]